MSEAAVGKPKAVDTIFFVGLAIGILDFIDASTFFPLYYGITFQQVCGARHLALSAATLQKLAVGTLHYSGSPCTL